MRIWTCLRLGSVAGRCAAAAESRRRRHADAQRAAAAARLRGHGGLPPGSADAVAQVAAGWSGASGVPTGRRVGCLAGSGLCPARRRGTLRRLPAPTASGGAGAGTLPACRSVGCRGDPPARGGPDRLANELVSGTVGRGGAPARRLSGASRGLSGAAAVAHVVAAVGLGRHYRRSGATTAAAIRAGAVARAAVVGYSAVAARQTARALLRGAAPAAGGDPAGSTARPPGGDGSREIRERGELIPRRQGDQGRFGGRCHRDRT